MKKDITELFVFIDDFYQAAHIYLQKHLLNKGKMMRKPTRSPQMHISEILTIVLLYHQSPCKNFKYFYNSYLQLYHAEFRHLVSYERFVQLKARVLPYMMLLLHWLTHTGCQTGISFIDSTALAVCHPKRISRHKVFQGMAAIGKNTDGWFYGFKLHLVINEYGQIQSTTLTPGNIDDRVPVPFLVKRLQGLLIGDKGYIKAELFQLLYDKGIKLVTGVRKRMKNILIPLFEKHMLRKRSLIETVFDYLKNKMELEHTRHRSIWNFLVHVFSTLIAYSLKSSKPSIKLNFALPS